MNSAPGILGVRRSRDRCVAARALPVAAALLALLVQSLLPLGDALYHARVGGTAEAADLAAGCPPTPHKRAPGDHPNCDLHKGIQLLGAGLLPGIALVLSALVLFFVFDLLWRAPALAGRHAALAQARAPPLA